MVFAEPIFTIKKKIITCKILGDLFKRNLFKYFDMEDNKDIGRQIPKTLWSSFLYNGITLASLSLFGNIPEHKDCLIIMLSGREMIHFISFNDFEDKLS